MRKKENRKKKYKEKKNFKISKLFLNVTLNSFHLFFLLYKD